MKFNIAGPFHLEMIKDNRLPDTSRQAQLSFWNLANDTYPKISDACGVYIFAVAGKNGGTRPWYVGQTRQRTFKKECFGAHKTNIYKDVTAAKEYADAMLFLVPKLTPGEKYAKPTTNAEGPRDIEFLETYFIGLALRRNLDLKNSNKTKFPRNLFVPGVLNANRGQPQTHLKQFKAMLGL